MEGGWISIVVAHLKFDVDSWRDGDVGAVELELRVGGVLVRKIPAWKGETGVEAGAGTIFEATIKCEKEKDSTWRRSNLRRKALEYRRSG